MFLVAVTICHFFIVPVQGRAALVAAIAFAAAMVGYVLIRRRSFAGRVIVTCERGLIVESESTKVHPFEHLSSVVAMRKADHMRQDFGLYAFGGNFDRRDPWRWHLHFGPDVVVVDESYEAHTAPAKAAIDALIARELPRAKAAFESGEAQTFGPFTIDRKGVRYGALSLAWADVEHVREVQGQVVIGRKPNRRFAAVDAAKVPNAVVLVPLAAWRLEREGDGVS